MQTRGVRALAAAALISISGAAHAAVITELPEGIAHEMPAVNRLIGGSSQEGQFGVRFGVDGALNMRVTDDQGRAANSFFGLTSQWVFGNSAEPFWTGEPPFATTGLYEGIISITFDAPQAAFLGRLNWGNPGTLKAFDTSGRLLEALSFAVETGRAPGFYGFRRSTNDIGRIELSGFNIGVRSISTSVPADAVPEPATWALMIGGFGAVGAAARRRRSPTLAHG